MNTDVIYDSHPDTEGALSFCNPARRFGLVAALAATLACGSPAFAKGHRPNRSAPPARAPQPAQLAQRPHINRPIAYRAPVGHRQAVAQQRPITHRSPIAPATAGNY